MARSQVCTSWHERHGTLQQSRGTAAFVSSTCYLDVKLSFLRPGWLSMSRCCSPWLLLPRSYLWSMWMVWCTGTLAAPWLVSIPTEFGRHAQRGVRRKGSDKTEIMSMCSFRELRHDPNPILHPVIFALKNHLRSLSQVHPTCERMSESLPSLARACSRQPLTT